MGTPEHLAIMGHWTPASSDSGSFPHRASVVARTAVRVGVVHDAPIHSSHLLLTVAACADDDVEDTTPPIDELDTPDDKEDAGVDDAVPPDAGSTEGPCGWLTPDDISDAMGLAVERATPADGVCTWDVSDEAAVAAGPNQGEDAVLRVSAIDQQAFDAARDAGSNVEPVDGVGDEAFVQFAADESETTIFVVRPTSP